MKAGDAARRARLKKLYNITPEEYELILIEQGGKCICGYTVREGKKRLAVDHDHKTGLIRGGLCWICNRVIGILRDDAGRFQSIANYLKAPPATRALGGERFGKVGAVQNKRRKKRKKR